MRDYGGFVSDQPEMLTTPGYTYFGQLVDHDLTYNPLNLRDSAKAPEDTPNLATPKLDLDNLYGRNPRGQDPDLLSDGVLFKIGPSSKTGHSYDVATDGDQPIVGDPRTLENVILRQMVAFFARLHNLAVEQFRESISEPGALFRRARQQTTWQYQWLVYNDYLRRILHVPVYRRIFEKRDPTVTWSVFSIPIEFAVAGMRFGHSMVRENYRISIRVDKDLGAIMDRSLKTGTLEDEWEVDWGRYFQGAGSHPAMAMTSRPIDARIVQPLFSLPQRTYRLFSQPSRENGALNLPDPTAEATELPVVTLLRGAATLIASGQTAAAFFGEPVLTDAELICKVGTSRPTDAGVVLRDANMVSTSSLGTPLWYYILKESEVRNNGNRLGPVGSWVVGETIYGSLLHDPDSFINAEGPEPKPPIWRLPQGERQIKTLRELFRLADSI
jgi:hypothetical protein